MTKPKSDAKPVAYIGIGVPGCGKTTFLKPLSEKEKLIYVNRDDIRLQLTGDATNHSKEPAVTRFMYDLIADALQQGQGVVVDATHSRIKDRRTMTEFCRDHGAVRTIAVWFDVPIDTCRKRNAGRSRVVNEAVLFTMQHRLSINPPSLDEGFDEIMRNST